MSNQSVSWLLSIANMWLMFLLLPLTLVGAGMVEFQMYKFLSNEYRFFPLTMEIDLCKEMARDSYGIKESLKKSLNFELSWLIKKGFLQLVYGDIDFSKFPPYIPHGEYKAESNVYDNDNFVLAFNYYCKIEEVIKKWEHSTKRTIH